MSWDSFTDYDRANALPRPIPSSDSAIAALLAELDVTRRERDDCIASLGRLQARTATAEFTVDELRQQIAVAKENQNAYWQAQLRTEAKLRDVERERDAARAEVARLREMLTKARIYLASLDGRTFIDGRLTHQLDLSKQIILMDDVLANASDQAAEDVPR